MAFYRKKKMGQPSEMTPGEAQNRLEHFCAYRERSPKEVRRKIAELGLDEDAAQALYDTLESDGFFQESRFAEAFAGGKFRANHWGKVRIRMELRHTHGVRAELIEAVLEQIPEEDYMAALRQILAKKIAQLPADDPLIHQKAAASAIRAGFEPELVFKNLPQ